jgi:hypothetical protein
VTSRMPERARTDLWEPWGSNPPGPPGPDPNVARLRPHGGNSRPEGIVQSYFVRQQKDILPKTSSGRSSCLGEAKSDG